MLVNSEKSNATVKRNVNNAVISTYAAYIPRQNQGQKLSNVENSSLSTRKLRMDAPKPQSQVLLNLHPL